MWMNRFYVLEISLVICPLKIYFLSIHLHYFPDNCGDKSERKGDRFHRDISTMEDRYRWNVTINILADYHWSLLKKIIEIILYPIINISLTMYIIILYYYILKYTTYYRNKFNKFRLIFPIFVNISQIFSQIKKT